MAETISYEYSSPSKVFHRNGNEELLLSKYSEIQKRDSSCFFWGKLTQPYLTARCLLVLSNVVQSSFNLSGAILRDPIVTAGNDKIRFEGFSHCAGVYARVDILSNGHDGEFLENGTTNVDFNESMLSALSRIRKSEKLILSVGKKELSLSRGGEKIIERKVPLPTKWIKGLTTVQIYMGESEMNFQFNRMQAIQLFRSIPKGKIKTDYYLIKRGNRFQFSPVQSKSGICIGGLHRLKLLDPLIPLVDSVRVFSHPKDQSSTWQLYLGDIIFSFSMSRDFWRGFSGEGAALESLVEDVPEAWITYFDKYSYANQTFNPTLLAIDNDLDFKKIENLSGRLSAMGMLGFDLDENQFFYRRLPFKLNKILSLNPRLKNAEKLIEKGLVKIISKNSDKVEAKVGGSGVHHTVLLEGNKQRCTCLWFSQNQGERGICKHILALKKYIS